jgi:LssY-like putative type I secretion system component LssY
VRRFTSLAFLLSVVLVSGLPSFPQGNPQAPAEYSFTISASQPWTDAGVDLAAGDVVTLTAHAKSGSADDCSPAGTKSASSDQLQLANAPAGALLARIGENGAPVLVGASGELHADSAGHLFLGINGGAKADCTFDVKAKIAHSQNSTQQPTQRNVKDQLSSAAKVWLQGQFGKGTGGESSNAVSSNSAAGASASTSAPGLKVPSVILDSDLRKHIDELPRRVHDHAGNSGDMVNFVIIGSQEHAQAALDAADWHLADVDSKEAGLKAIMNTYEKKDYLQMPMSHLYLFDRMQDFGYEQAQAFSVVASRHHFRIWKAPFTWSGETVWVGAGTHDIGFEKDVRTGHLTHKIDPEVDLERENIAHSLDKSGEVKSMTYYLPPDPVQDAKNASGGGYHSDGKLLVVFLK